MRITIPKDKYPDIEKLPLSISKTLVIKALDIYQYSDEYKEIVSVFSKGMKRSHKEEKINKATLYSNKSKSYSPTVVSTHQVLTDTVSEFNAIDDNNIDIMGGFDYE